MFRVGNLHSRSLLGSWPCWPHQHEFVPSCRIIQTSGPRGRWRSDPESIPQFWRQHGGTGPCRDRRGPGGGDCGSGWRKRTRSRTGASLSPEQTRSSGQGAIGQRQPCPRHTTSHRHLIHHMTERGGGLLPVQCFRGLLSWQRRDKALGQLVMLKFAEVLVCGLAQRSPASGRRRDPHGRRSEVTGAGP